MNSARSFALAARATCGAVLVANAAGCEELPDVVFVEAGTTLLTQDGAAVGTANNPVPSPTGTSDASEAIDPASADANTSPPPVLSSSGGGVGAGSSSGGSPWPAPMPAPEAGAAPTPPNACPLQPRPVRTRAAGRFRASG